MYITIEPSIGYSVERLPEMQRDIEQRFPWNDVLHSVLINHDEDNIHVVFFGILSDEQVDWLDDNYPDYYGNAGGVLTVPVAHPTAYDVPCFYHPDHGVSYPYISWNGDGTCHIELSMRQRYVRFETQAELDAILRASGLEEVSWVRRIQLCNRCGNAGGYTWGHSYDHNSRCDECENEYKKFMNVLSVAA